MDCQKCSNCDKVCRVLPCDSCKRLLCVRCDGLTSLDLKCLELKMRQLIFLYDDCSIGFWKIPEILNERNEFKEEIKQIQAKPGPT